MSINRYFKVMACIILILSVANKVIASSSSEPASPDLSLFHEAGHGRVHVHGSILDTACAISTDNKVQTIDLGLSSSQALFSRGYGPVQTLNINLEHCTVKNSTGGVRWKNITATLMGAVDVQDPRLFALTGEAKGIGIQIRDRSGKMILPGEIVTAGDISQREIKLVFLIRLAADSEKMSDGAGSATIKLKINYD